MEIEDYDDKENQTKRAKTSRFQFDFCNFLNENNGNISKDNSIYTVIKDCSRKYLGKFFGEGMDIQIFPLGFFQMMPDEILLDILNKSSISDLGNLCLSHIRFRNLIINHFFLSKCGPKIFMNDLHMPVDGEEFSTSDDIVQKFSVIGILVRKATCLMPTVERVDFLIKIIKNTYGFLTSDVFRYMDYKSVKFIWKCYGTMIERLSLGWSDEEYLLVYDTIANLFQLDSYITIFLKSIVGSKQACELYIRCFCRMVCNSFEQTETFGVKLTWFMRLTGKYDIDDRAKLMIVVFGPLICINDIRKSLPFVGWWDLCDSNFIRVGLEDLALTIRLIYMFPHQHNEWSKKDIVKITDVITKTPDAWLPINLGILYNKCGMSFTKFRVVQDMQKNEFEKAVSTFCYSTIATYKLNKMQSPVNTDRKGDFMKNIVEAMENLMDTFGTIFLSEFYQYIKKIIFDLTLDIPDEPNETGFNMKDLIHIQNEMLKHFMVRVMKLKQESD